MKTIAVVVNGTTRALAALVAGVALTMATGATLSAEGLIEPKSAELFERMAQTLGKAETLRFQAYTFYDDFEASGVKVKRGMVQDVTIRRPDRLHFRTMTEDGTVREGWYDGKLLSVAQPQKKIYAQVEVPGTLDGLSDVLQEQYQINLPTVDLLYNDLYGKLADHILSGVYVGEKIIRGARVDHISFETTPADLQIWLSKGAKPLPQRMVINYIALEGQPEFLVVFHEWAVNDFANDGAFSFTAPAGWERVEIPRQQARNGKD